MTAEARKALTSRARRWAGHALVVPWYSRLGTGATPLLPAWAASTALLAVLWGVLLIRQHLGTAGAGPLAAHLATGAFFVTALPTTASLTVWHQRRLQEDARRLAAHLRLDRGRAEALLAGLVRVPRRLRLRQLGIGAAIAAAHDAALGGTTWMLLVGTAPVTLLPVLVSLCTYAIWILIWDIATQLVGNALQLADLTEAELRLDLAPDPAAQVLGGIALRSALPVLALVAAMPLMLLDGTPRLTATLPGLVASMLLIAGVVSLPLRGLRRRTRTFKARQLEALDRAIASLGALDPDGPRDVERHRARELSLLVALRREVQHLSAWPLGSQGTRTLVLYGVIPPLTWIAAALVELSLERWL